MRSAVDNRFSAITRLAPLAGLALAFPPDAARAADPATAQWTCHFTYAALVRETIERAEIDWHTTLAMRGRSGRVIVKGSGDYKARARRFESGAAEFVFRTDVSKERITVGPGGNALWEINFKNGDFFTYVGGCQTARVGA